jgi:hypothetical protein
MWSAPDRHNRKVHLQSTQNGNIQIISPNGGQIDAKRSWPFGKIQEVNRLSFGGVEWETIKGKRTLARYERPSLVLVLDADAS